MAQFYWPVRLLSIAVVTLDCTNLVRPWWSGLRAAIRVGIDASAALAASLLMRSGALLWLAANEISGENPEPLRQAIESGLQVTLAIVAIVSVFGCFQGFAGLS